MKEHRFKKETILVAGDEKLTFSVVVCLLQTGHQVVLYTKDREIAAKCINAHFTDICSKSIDVLDRDDFEIISELNLDFKSKIALVITAENLLEKVGLIQKLEKHIENDAIIAINTESIALSNIQKYSQAPHRVIGVNWTEPAHTTYFLEIISNEINSESIVKELFNMAKVFWRKDPYILKKDFGIRSRMIAAMAREAFYLIENGYVNVEDIDRACKNDAGYYLPFAGNFRYMDLMGTYAYGMVMKDLYPELSKETCIPDFFREIINNGGLGMENKQGFYTYKDGDAARWDEVFRKFSYDIQEIISKYPFSSIEENV